jgi:hypothetical protein
MSKLLLETALKASYKDKEQGEKDLAKSGYILDKQLSNIQSRVYFKPDDKKLIVSYRGTMNLINDIPTDFAILTGTLKNTTRYKESQKVLDDAKKKYGVNATVIGHSLGGSLSSAVNNDKNDKIINWDKGVGIFNSNKTKSNESAYRQRGDLISLLGSSKIKSLGDLMWNPLAAHDLGRLSKLKKPIFV